MSDELSDWEFLDWLHDRINLVYNESNNLDFMLRLQEIINNMKKPKVCETCKHYDSKDSWCYKLAEYISEIGEHQLDIDSFGCNFYQESEVKRCTER